MQYFPPAVKPGGKTWEGTFYRFLSRPVLTMWLQRFRKRCSVTGLRITRLAETAFPLELNSLSVGDDGELHRIDPRARPFGFTFECLGLRFTASTRVRQGKLWLQLAANVGPVPYTAESVDRRRDTLAIMRSASTLPHGRVGISHDRQIEISGELQLSEPLTPVHVLSAAAEIILEIKPYAALIADFIPITERRAVSRA